MEHAYGIARPVCGCCRTLTPARKCWRSVGIMHVTRPRSTSISNSEATASALFGDDHHEPESAEHSLAKELWSAAALRAAGRHLHWILGCWCGVWRRGGGYGAEA